MSAAKSTTYHCFLDALNNVYMWNGTCWDE